MSTNPILFQAELDRPADAYVRGEVMRFPGLRMLTGHEPREPRSA